jgi:hypothetical protein
MVPIMTTPTGLYPLEIVSVPAFDQPGVPIYYLRRRKSWQKAPFDLPLPYEFTECEYYPGRRNDLGSPLHTAESLPNYQRPSDNTWTQLRNKAYERFRGKLYDKLQLGVDFIELKKSYSMIAGAAMTLVDFTRKVRKLDFVGAARTLNMSSPPGDVRKTRKWQDNWLEYTYGWKPLVMSISDACEIAKQPVKTFVARGGSPQYLQNGEGTQNFGSTTRFHTWWTATGCMNGGEVVSVDADTFMWSQMGLNNPLKAAWELVPFSFVLDWVLNVGDILDTIDDFNGMVLKSTYNTAFWRIGEAGNVKLSPGFSSSTPPRFFRGSAVVVSRQLGIVGPVFSVKTLKLPSKARVTTAVALLLQVLGGGKVWSR